MEVAGLIIGIAGLVGAFKECVELFSQIAALAHYGHDFEMLSLKLDIEKTLMLQWASRLKLAKTDHDKRLEDEIVQKTIFRVLTNIKLLFLKTTALTEKYGVQQAEPRELDELVEADPTISGPRLDQFTKDFDALNIKIHDCDKKVSVFTKTRWVIKDKEKFEHLLRDISYFVQKLNEIVPDKGELAISMTQKDIDAIVDLKGRQRILSASVGQETIVAKIARQKITELCEQRILGSIWFRTMNSRREKVSDPHNKTFEWALGEDESSEWNNLSRWLTSGSGIYWVSGKAGSGKSTLMKFLHDHSRTASLLASWAGTAKLHIASCFLWNLGSVEQKSLEGLLRTLLYHLLEANPSRICDLLPEMWKAVAEDEFADLGIPSYRELLSVFEKVARGPEDTSICFFIDGLDEYSGDFADAIKAIKSLCQGSRVKAVVSSRRIPACVEAFSEMPKMRLQDLTGADIARYIHETVGAHPYMSNLIKSEPLEASVILEELTLKASGVFLWVVLASRSILNGFAAYDKIAELRGRIDELPPELEDLFRHMLEKIEKRYRDQSVKILRLAYYNRARSNTRPLQTLGLALVDDHDMDLYKMPRHRFLSTEEKKAKSAILKGRLRSRCGGLLEISSTKMSIKLPISGLGFEQQWEVKLEKCPIIDSTVEFMHRTVYEFLDSPLTWQLDCLKIEDEMFDPNAVLSAMSLHLAEQSACEEGGTIKTEDHIIDTLQYGAKADRIKPGSVTTVFDQLEELLRELYTSPRQWDLLENVFANSNPLSVDVASSATLLLALEANAVNAAKQRLLDIGKKAMTGASNFPLLYHVISRPFLGIMPSYMMGEFPISRDLVRFLLFSGCDPNEKFKDSWYSEKTPWICWVEHMSATNVTEAVQPADITEDFLASDAQLNAVEDTFGETLEERIRGSFLNSRNRRHKGWEEVEQQGLSLVRLIREKEAVEKNIEADLHSTHRQDGRGTAKRKLSPEENITCGQRKELCLDMHNSCR